jgi:hypothetical protein
MLSFEKCKNILISQGERYSDDEIKFIMNVLNQFSIIEYTFFKNKLCQDGTSYNLHSRKYGGAGR